ncbi:hypothetical protein BS50DRAFT_665666 [Corynespora cassiicola Philippines]|uniref:Rhodopsin domain-containing protein n=1 Tax=Corynespora cassiicola Philippines TaxID=1448308 RepID=A0A2T2NRM9_CORCC|nr:hypothetical protein BS50DRAFT_665666 [Corynespora cassiicola Philippines]
MKHNYSKEMMIILALIFLSLPFLFVALRIWAKIVTHRIALDDYLTLAALVISTTCCSLQLVTAIYGHLGQHQPLDDESEPIMDDPGLIIFQSTKFVLNTISVVGLGLVKASILVLYKKIFDVRKFRIAVHVVLAFVVGWTVSFFFSHLFTCYPITVFIEPYYGNNCVKTVPMFLAVLFTDVLADIIILVLPIPMVMSIKLEPKQKMAAIGMFMLGASVVAVSVTRVIATFSVAREYLKHPDDVIYYTAPIFFWTNIELSLAIVCACLPTLRPLYSHLISRPINTNHSSGYGYSSSTRAGTRYEDVEEMELPLYDKDLSVLPSNRVHFGSNTRCMDNEFVG